MGLEREKPAEHCAGFRPPALTRRVDLLIELDRSSRASSNYEKFRRYDALINGWALSLPRYKTLGEPPVVAFVVEDEEKARQFLEAADTLVTGRVGKYGVAESQWPHYGRRRIFLKILIAHGQSSNAEVRVLVHELAHALGVGVGYQEFGRRRAEAIVECVTYLVCAGQGLDVEPSSVPYIAGWAGDEPDVLERDALLIDRLAGRIERALTGGSEAATGVAAQ